MLSDMYKEGLHTEVQTLFFISMVHIVPHSSGKM